MPESELRRREVEPNCPLPEIMSGKVTDITLVELNGRHLRYEISVSNGITIKLPLEAGQITIRNLTIGDGLLIRRYVGDAGENDLQRTVAVVGERGNHVMTFHIGTELISSEPTQIVGRETTKGQPMVEVGDEVERPITPDQEINRTTINF